MAISCIAIVAGSLVHVLPAYAMTIAWSHSVEGSRWEEDYEIRGEALALPEARVRASGAGMDAIEGAVWKGGWWRYAPDLPPLREVTLANSAFVAGYTICWNGICRPLEALVPRGLPATLTVRPC